MSRIGKLPINVPSSVKVLINESYISIEGKFGTLELNIPTDISVSQNDNKLTLTINETTKTAKSAYGLYRSLIANMVIGVSEQFTKTLILKGVGYRAAVQNDEIVLNLGYSHQILIKVPEKISVEVIKNTTINLKSCDKELLGLFAANIRAWRKPEPYKGKGILYENEQILRKAGKSAK